MKKIFCCIIIIFVALQLFAQHNWKMYDIAQGVYPRMQIDANGKVHFAYLRSGSGTDEVVYTLFDRNDNKGVSYSTMEGSFISPINIIDMQLNSKGLPVIVAHNHTSGGNSILASTTDGINFTNRTINHPGHDGWENALWIDKDVIYNFSIDNATGPEYFILDGDSLNIQSFDLNRSNSYMNGTDMMVIDDVMYAFYFDNDEDNNDTGILKLIIKPKNGTKIIRNIAKNRIFPSAWHIGNNQFALAYAEKQGETAMKIKFAMPTSDSTWSEIDIATVKGIQHDASAPSVRKLVDLTQDSKGAFYISYSSKDSLYMATNSSGKWLSNSLPVSLSSGRTIGYHSEIKIVNGLPLIAYYQSIGSGNAGVIQLAETLADSTNVVKKDSVAKILIGQDTKSVILNVSVGKSGVKIDSAISDTTRIANITNSELETVVTDSIITSVVELHIKDTLRFDSIIDNQVVKFAKIIDSIWHDSIISQVKVSTNYQIDSSVSTYTVRLINRESGTADSTIIVENTITTSYAIDSFFANGIVIRDTVTQTSEPVIDTINKIFFINIITPLGSTDTITIPKVQRVLSSKTVKVASTDTTNSFIRSTISLVLLGSTQPEISITETIISSDTISIDTSTISFTIDSTWSIVDTIETKKFISGTYEVTQYNLIDTIRTDRITNKLTIIVKKFNDSVLIDTFRLIDTVHLIDTVLKERNLIDTFVVATHNISERISPRIARDSVDLTGGGTNIVRYTNDTIRINSVVSDTTFKDRLLGRDSIKTESILGKDSLIITIITRDSVRRTYGILDTLRTIYYITRYLDRDSNYVEVSLDSAGISDTITKTKEIRLLLGRDTVVRNVPKSRTYPDDLVLLDTSYRITLKPIAKNIPITINAFDLDGNKYSEFSIECTDPQGRTYQVLRCDTGSACYVISDFVSTTAIIRLKMNSPEWEKISISDIVQLRKILLAIKSNPCVADIYGGDANLDGQLLIDDLVLLRKISLGIITEFPDGQSHVFVDQSAVNNVDVINFSDFTQIKLTLKELEAGKVLNFVGYQLGDLPCDE